MKVISFLSGKGGVGKTTLTVLEAGALADSGFSVLVVDIDRQESTTEWTDRGRMPFDVVTTTDPAELDQLRRIDTVDYVIVDTPGSLERSDDLLSRVAAASDLVVMPVEPGGLGIKPTLTTIETVLKPARVPYVGLVSMFNPAHKGMDVQLRDALIGAGVPMLTTVVRRYAAHQYAPIEGIVTAGYRIDSRQAANAVGDVGKLALELLAVTSSGIPASAWQTTKPKGE